MKNIVSPKWVISNSQSLKLIKCTTFPPEPPFPRRIWQQDVVSAIKYCLPKSSPEKYIHIPNYSITDPYSRISNGISSNHKNILNEIINPSMKSMKLSEFNIDPFMKSISLDLFNYYKTKLDIKSNDTVVCYDSEFKYSPFCWWLFKTLGHDRVYILAEKSENDEDNECDKENQIYQHDVIEDNNQKNEMDSTNDTVSNMNENSYQTIDYQNLLKLVKDFSSLTPPTLLDCRPRYLYQATEDDQTFNDDKKEGFIPTSINISSRSLFNNGVFMNKDSIIQLLSELQIDLESQIITIAQTRVEAALLNLALDEAGVEKSLVFLYEGGFNEWARQNDAPTKMYKMHKMLMSKV